MIFLILFWVVLDTMVYLNVRWASIPSNIGVFVGGTKVCLSCIKRSLLEQTKIFLWWDKQNQHWSFNAGDCLIEVTVCTGLIVYIIEVNILQVNYIYVAN